MRIICHLFFTTFILFEIQKSARGNEKDGNGAIIDTKFVELDGSDDSEAEEPINKKEHSKGVKNFVGTNLFGDANGSRKNCFSSEDVALLAARRDFESLIPKDLPNCLLDDELAKLLMQYFYGAGQIIDKMTRGHSKTIAQKAFYDTLGGYLKYYMIPISKYSFYGGLVKLKTVESILELFSESKEILNTNGNGWRDPLSDFSDLDIQIEPLRIVLDTEDGETSCTQLDMLDERTGEDEEMLVSLPRLDAEEKGILGNVWLPFRRKRTFDLQSSKSAFVLLRYFELTTRCYKFQNINQDLFNKRFKDWILENLEIHLNDDVLYPGLGAVLRIIETLRRKRSDSFVIEVKSNEKRQKTNQNLKSSKTRKSKKVDNSNNVVKNIFEPISPDASESFMDMETFNQKEEDCQRRKYIYIAIAGSVCLVLIVFSVIACTLCKKRLCRKSKPDKPTSEPKKTSWFGCGKQPKDDEETLLCSRKSSNKSKSRKFSRNMEKPTNVQQEPESTVCCGVFSNKNSPAIIETSSMDSDSGRDNKNKLKSSLPRPKPTRTMVVDEKKRFSISKKNKNRDDTAKVGILKKGT